MNSFAAIYDRLNSAQKLAVDTIDGPVLVIAGPGTGKTQLLSARVAQILRTTDALPQNILCLTFTESGAHNMRDRLSRFIGKDAYDVAIGTYHSFGSDIIRRYPEYFTELRLERPIDELGKRQILEQILEKLPYSNPLKQLRHHPGDLVSTISEVKRGLLSPKDLRKIATANLIAIEQCSPAISEVLAPFAKRMPSKYTAIEAAFGTVLATLESCDCGDKLEYGQLCKTAAAQLTQALQQAADLQKTKPLTAWKNKWLEKNDQNQYILDGTLESRRMAALGDILGAYDTALQSKGLYDFDDMIVRTIEQLRAHNDLRFSLQEQYQYLLLDEFQDTNAAQFELVKLLTNNPVSEGRPNVLAVGDDDQAIYAFQGAQYSNMLDFYSQYTGVQVINLTENYRSSVPIIATARAVANQITDSLTSQLDGLDKDLVAAVTISSPSLEIREYQSDIAERAGVAQAIAELVTAGVEPNEIAVLAPKHSYLEQLVPYLAQHDIDIAYDRRENILQAPAIKQLLSMSRLVLAIHNRNWALADSLWPEVLSYDFWQHDTASIWELAWQARDDHEHWSKLLLESDLFRPCALLFLCLATQTETEPLEIMLDRLIGTEEVQTGNTTAPTVRSPYRDFYAGETTEPDRLYRVVTELAVLRSRLREHQDQQGDQLSLANLLDFVQQYESAGQQLLNTSPYQQSANAVQLMTVFKSKGLEFEHVFLLHSQDDVWGGAARDNSNKLTLPANLAPIRHAGTSEDERLRALFVAITRAKRGLHFSTFRNTYSGKQTTRLKYLLTQESDDGTTASMAVPEPYNVYQSADIEAPSLVSLEHDWRQRHILHDSSLQALLTSRLKSYRLSPTHVTHFIDLEHGGPHAFLLQNLLRFPTAPSLDIAFGNTMHGTLEWIQQRVNASNKMPTIPATLERFSELLAREHLYGEPFALQEARGREALNAMFAKEGLTFTAGDIPEYSFSSEGVTIGDAILNGKIDLLRIDKKAKTIQVVDYKTGSFAAASSKLHKYELQLYFYKLLIVGSHTYKDYTVTDGQLLFVEPDMNNGAMYTHTIQYKEDELERVRRLIMAIWQRIQSLNLPDISHYSTSLAAIKQLEKDLLSSDD